jgi:phenylalanine-4-hydroxylase
VTSFTPESILSGAAVSEADIVPLDPDHPGFRDPVYRRRRNDITRAALAYRESERVPRIDYTPEEQEVWRTVWRGLEPLHDRYACLPYLEANQWLKLDRAQVPQLADINDTLKGRTGFRMKPVPGLVSDRVFLGHLGRDYFLSTQYMRHHSTPLYTPEPDVVHEMVGHAATLAHPGFCDINREFGRAADHVDDATLARIARVYWYTVEFGLVREREKLKVYGAGLLSSFGEIGRFEKEATLRPWDLDAMASLPYDPTQYQAQLFVAPSFEQLVEDLPGWLRKQYRVAR